MTILLNMDPVTGPVGIPPLINKRFGDLKAGQCEWFAKCSEPAVYGVPHIMYGVVPTCAGCAEKVCALLQIPMEVPDE